jgi:hypothetical protein
MHQFYDVALVEICKGNMISTWAGLACSLTDALLNLMERAEGKIPEPAHNLIVMRLENKIGGNLKLDYGWVLRSSGPVRQF